MATFFCENITSNFKPRYLMYESNALFLGRDRENANLISYYSLDMM